MNKYSIKDIAESVFNIFVLVSKVVDPYKIVKLCNGIKLQFSISFIPK